MLTEKKQRAIYVVTDFLTTALAWFAFNSIRFHDIISHTEHYASFGRFLAQRTVCEGQILFPLLMLGIYYLSGYYNKVFLKSRIEEFNTTFYSTIIGTILIYFIAIVDDPIPDRQSNYILLLMLSGLLFTFVYGGRLCSTIAVNRRIASGQLRFNVLIVGDGQDAMDLRAKLEDDINLRSHAYRIIGYVTPADTEPTSMDLPVYRMDELEEQCAKLDIKALVATSHNGGQQSALDSIYKLLPLHLPILISPNMYELITTKPKLDRLIAEPLIDITHANMSESTSNMKRVGDIVVSAITLAGLLPLLACIAMAVKSDSKGPVFYSQERIGRRSRPFRILKFRTMRTDAESEGPALSSLNDPRITRVGHFLRKYRLDELPQFWNVLKGDMSIIGPRPERAFYIHQIMERAPY